jgi:integrase
MPRRGDGIYQRGKSWYLDCRIDGRRHVARLGKGITRSVAQDLAQVKRAAILKGEAGIGRKRRDATFDQAVEEFLKWARAEKRPNTVRSYAGYLDALRLSFAGKRLSELHPFLIEKHKRTRLEAGARVMANRELEVLTNLFNRCREWNLYEGDNPATVVKRIPEPRTRLRYLDPDEEARLLAEAREPIRTIILTGIHAGLRVRSEALTLTWPNVDLTRGLLTVQAGFAKTGQSRTVPINSTLRAALERLKRTARGEAVFARSDGRPVRSFIAGFQLACERAGLPDVTPHVLRHTFASRLVMAGVDLRTVQELGGWKSLAMVERYSHLSRPHVAAAIERIATRPTALVSQQDSQQPLQAVDVSSRRR